MKKLLLGDEAIAQGAIDAGLSGVYAYPGTPSTEITEYIQGHALARERGVHSRWCTNEKTAMEAALGMSFMGKRALVCMKHVGLNVCADPFVNSGMTGVNGGLVVLVADDPSMHSSQDEQDSRFYGKFAMIPTFEPSSQQEAYDMMSVAFEYSEQQCLPVLMRVTTRMAHSRAVVECADAARQPNPLNYDSVSANWVLLPANARRRNDKVTAQQATLEADAAASPYNRYESPSSQASKPYPLGILASGIAYNYVVEALKILTQSDVLPLPLLKVSQYPLPKTLVRRLLDECGQVLVVEEGQPFIEEQVRGVFESQNILGRLTGELPRTGELTPDCVVAALQNGPFNSALGACDASPREELSTLNSQFSTLNSKLSTLNSQLSTPNSPLGACDASLREELSTPNSQLSTLNSPLISPRPPQLCQGCGHRDVYTALNEVLKEFENPRVFGDIGCYTLGFLPPYRAIHSCVDMGASITMAKGAADAGQWPAVAIIGDSTFTHSGMTGLLDAVNENADITVIISDNLTTAMTGGQDSAGTNKFEAICRGLGVAEDHLHVVVPLPKNMPEITRIIRQEINYHGVSVIIPRRECIQTFKRHAKEKKQENKS